MSSTSVRVPDTLLDRLHEAQIPGVSLAQVVETALEIAGGPEAVRRHLEQALRRERAKAQVARLRRIGHRSVVLEPSEQVALASAIGAWVRLLEEQGHRSFDPQTRRLELSGPGTGSGRHQGTPHQPRGMTLERGSGEVLG